MRLSRSRLLLRLALLLAFGTFLLVRAARGLRGGEAPAGLAAAQALLGAVALLAAAAAALSLRGRPRSRTLHLPREPSREPPAPREDR